MKEKRSVLLADPEMSWRTVCQDLSASQKTFFPRDLSKLLDIFERGLDVYETKQKTNKTQFSSQHLKKVYHFRSTTKRNRDFHKQSMHHFGNSFCFKKKFSTRQAGVQHFIQHS
jgi:hypothetical protein